MALKTFQISQCSLILTWSSLVSSLRRIIVTTELNVVSYAARTTSMGAFCKIIMNVSKLISLALQFLHVC